MTPMQIFKTQLTTLKSLDFVTLTELNRKNSKNAFVANVLYSSKEVMFDYLVLFNISSSGVYRNDKKHVRYNQNFGFAINYKDIEPTIRATIKLGKESGIEYSREYSVAEFKSLINDFTHKELMKSNALNEFKTIFDIKYSNELSTKNISELRNKYKKTINDIISKLSNLQGKRNQLFSNKEFDKNKLKLIVDEMNSLYEEKTAIFKAKSKDMPAIVRKFIFREFKLK